MGKNAFIPKTRGNLAIVDGRIDETTYKKLLDLDLKVVKTIKCQEVDESISYHPDIVMHPVNHKTLVIAPNVYEYYAEELKGLGLNLIKGSKYLKSNYPEDIGYNVGRIGNMVIHKIEHMDERLKKLLENEGLEFINVKQGYSKCSLALCGEAKGITADRPIYKILKERGVDILLIEAGYIDLPGQDYGFIGGCFGNLCEDKLLLSGSLDKHISRESIEKFTLDRELLYLSESNIIDLGTIIIMEIEEEV